MPAGATKSYISLETQKLNLMTEVSELKLKLVGMEKEQKEQEEKQKKAEVSVINHPYCPKLRSGEAIVNVASGHLVNPKPDSHSSARNIYASETQ